MNNFIEVTLGSKKELVLLCTRRLLKDAGMNVTDDTTTEKDAVIFSEFLSNLNCKIEIDESDNVTTLSLVQKGNIQSEIISQYKITIEFNENSMSISACKTI